MKKLVSFVLATAVILGSFTSLPVFANIGNIGYVHEAMPTIQGKYVGEFHEGLKLIYDPLKEGEQFQFSYTTPNKHEPAEIVEEGVVGGSNARYVNEKNETVIQGEGGKYGYTYHDFSEGLAVVYISTGMLGYSTEESTSSSFYIDKTGKKVFEVNNAVSYSFSQGKAVVVPNDDNEQLYVIDKTGKKLFTLNIALRSAEDNTDLMYSDSGLLVVNTLDGSNVYDSQGNLVKKYNGIKLGSFYDGIAYYKSISNLSDIEFDGVIDGRPKKLYENREIFVDGVARYGVDVDGLPYFNQTHSMGLLDEEGNECLDIYEAVIYGPSLENRYFIEVNQFYKPIVTNNQIKILDISDDSSKTMDLSVIRKNPIGKRKNDMTETVAPIKTEQTPEVKSTVVNFKDTPLKLTTPVVNKNGTTYYPMRELIEAMGGEVLWDAEKRMASGVYNGITVSFVIDNNQYTINEDAKNLPEGQAPFIDIDKTYLPIRAVAESFGYTVTWNEETSGIDIK